MMADPGLRVNPTIFDQGDDSRKVGRKRIPRRQQRHLTPVHERVTETHLLGRDADEDEFASMANIV